MLRAVKVICSYGFFRVPAQLFPIVSLSENAFCQAFSDEPAIRFLAYFKNNGC